MALVYQTKIEAKKRIKELTGNVWKDKNIGKLIVLAIQKDFQVRDLLQRSTEDFYISTFTQFRANIRHKTFFVLQAKKLNFNLKCKKCFWNEKIHRGWR